MDFDLVSFLLGFGSASGISYGLWRYRERLRTLQEAAEEQAEGAREFLKRSVDARYAQVVTAYLQRYHLSGAYTNLSEIVHEPHLLLDSILPDLPDEEDQDPDAHQAIIPLVHRFPEVYAEYNLENIPLSDVLVGDPHVAILGLPGMGKSTALATLGLMALDEISFETSEDRDMRALEGEYEGLSDVERAQRQNELAEARQRAVEKLRMVQDRDDVETLAGHGPEITTLFPVFLHLGDIDLDLNIYGTEVDPAEPVVRAIQRYVSLLTAQSMAPLIYQQLAIGNALVLLDGFEELASSQQAQIYQWLQSFLQAYGQNRVIITGPASGYDALLQLGFAPTIIKPWSEYETSTFIQQWITKWPSILDAQQQKKKVSASPPVDQQIVRRLMADNRLRMPMEITVKILAALLGDERTIGLRGAYERYTRDTLPDQEYSPAIVREIARVMLDRDIILKQEQIVEIVTKYLTPAEEDAKPVLNIDQFTKDLFSKDLFVKRAGNTYDFRHPLIRAYFGAESLIEDHPQRVAEVAPQANWHTSLGIAAADLDLTPAVHQKLSSAPDLLFSSRFSIVRWVPNPPPHARWRGELLKRLGAALLAPSQYTILREQALGGLIASRDPNVAVVLRQAIRSGNPELRRLACIGLGAIGAEEALADLRPMLVDDAREVQMAAAKALGAVGTEAALEIMVQGLLEGDDLLRQVIAEALAGIPGEGEGILHDAVEHEDMQVRRAAVFGLARIPASWALLSLYRAMLEDSQWYVRSAAEYAFARARAPEKSGPRRHLPTHQLPWLVQWATAQGEAVPEGEGGQQMLIQALQHAPTPIRVIAARTLGKLGILNAIKPLYLALTDQDEAVRTAAYDGLGRLQERVTRPLPAIVWVQ
ncbi:MAG: hypothetical protein GYB66_08700 [Chloroflexi bacterium]|nr:hypothetical protein [Chloroflexota bacterium]